MYICMNCNFKTEMPAKFCPHCGQAMAVIQQEPVRPVYSPATPVYVSTGPEVSLGKKIVGMALGIGGLVCSVLAFLYTIIGLLSDDVSSYSYYGYSYYSYNDEVAEMFYILGIVFGIIGLVLSIIGATISASSGADGRKLGFSKAGKICGIIGVVLSAIAFMVSVSYL